MRSYWNYWGKVNTKGDAAIGTTWHPVVYHSLDVTAVAYLSHIKNESATAYWADRLDLNFDGLGYLVTVAALLHDVGKFSKTFQSLAPDIYAEQFPGAKPRTYTIRHDSLGLAVWRGDPIEMWPGLRNVVRRTSKSLDGYLNPLHWAAFGHHGIPPLESTHGGNQPLLPGRFFDPDDIEAIEKYVTDALAAISPVALAPPAHDRGKPLREYSWYLAGALVIADWIGSNTAFFPFRAPGLPLDAYWHDVALPNAKAALSTLYRPATKARRYQAGHELCDIYPFLSRPSPLQQAVREIPVSQSPSLYILEDVTGSGKTEAALILASRIMALGGAAGVYIALPTTATANAMYARMRGAYRALYESSERPSLILAHGAAHLSDSFVDSVGFLPLTTDEDNFDAEASASIQCNAWYADNRKKALLADVGVGTVDQALLAVLPARHQCLRLVGLQGKILIVDEVHAYDEYMRPLLTTLLRAHAAAGGSAILLSATIPNEKRLELIEAHGGPVEPQTAESVVKEKRFPLLSARSGASFVTVGIGTRENLKRSLTVGFVHDFEDVLARVEAMSARGQAVCWIRNTVSDAITAYQTLLARDVVDSHRVRVFHSRFAMVDRLQIEDAVICHFGKDSAREDRQGQVLIATQVVEQSLDLDFDELITDLAPIDLVIQRAGRLRRHPRAADGSVIRAEHPVDDRGTAVLHVYSPVFVDEPNEDWLAGPFAGTAAVYVNAGVLWRTARVLTENQGWRMPDDARMLIERVYAEEASVDIPSGLETATLAAEGKAHAGKAMGHLSALKLEKGYRRGAVGSGEWDEDEAVSTRLADDTIEVALCTTAGNTIVPYAAVNRLAWDYSLLRVPAHQWDDDEINPPPESVGDTVRQEHKRLRHVAFYVVSCRSNQVAADGSTGTRRYNAVMGWGHYDPQEIVMSRRLDESRT